VKNCRSQIKARSLPQTSASLSCRFSHAGTGASMTRSCLHQRERVRPCVGGSSFPPTTRAPIVKGAPLLRDFRRCARAAEKLHAFV
jgi:hypothetical protein